MSKKSEKEHVLSEAEALIKMLRKEVPDELNEFFNLISLMKEGFMKEFGGCMEDVARDNSQFGFLAAVALLKHLSIRLDKEEFGPVVLEWVRQNVERAKECPLWHKVFADTSDQCDCFLESISEDDEEDDE